MRTLDAGDWQIVREGDDTVFTGYEKTDDGYPYNKIPYC